MARLWERIKDVVLGAILVGLVWSAVLYGVGSWHAGRLLSFSEFADYERAFDANVISLGQ